MFGLIISEGAIANTLARAGTLLTAAAGPIADAVRQSSVVRSGEISAWVGGKTWWQWVPLSSGRFHGLTVTIRRAPRNQLGCGGQVAG